MDHCAYATTEVVIEAKGVQWRVGRRKLSEAEMEVKYTTKKAAEVMLASDTATPPLPGEAVSAAEWK